VQVNFDSRQNFGALNIDKASKYVITRRTYDAHTHLKISIMKRVLSESPLSYTVSTGKGIFHNRLQTVVRNQDGKVIKCLKESYMSSLFYSPKNFFKKLLKFNKNNKYRKG